MHKKFFITIFFSFQILSIAQDNSLFSELDEITVSANKNETTLFKTASSVSIITQEEIKLKQSSSVVELLKDLPGLMVSQQGGPGKLSSLFMRGSNSNFVLVMIDNVEVNDASSSNNGYDFSTLQLSDIEKIEIVRGPQSTLYGSEAAAGIVNILTKSGSGSPGITIQGEGGTNNHYQGSLSTKGAISGFNYLANYSRLQTDGISAIRGNDFENDGYKSNAGFIKIGYDVNDRISTNLSYKYIDSKSDLDQAMADGDDPNFITNIESHLVNYNIKGNIIEHLWESSLRGSFYGSEIKTNDSFDELNPSTSSDSRFSGNRFSFNWQNNLTLIENNLITLGIDSKKDEADSKYHSESAFGPFDSNFPKKSLNTTGIYIQDYINYFNFSSTIGYRYDHNEKFGSVSTFRFAPMYFISETNTKIKGSYGTGFKAPSLYNLFAPFYGNIDLKPEKSDGWDLGIEQFIFNNKLLIGITYFDIKFEDMLGFNENFQSINVNEAETNGIEAILKINNFNGFSVSANYTYNQTVDLSIPDKKNEQLIRRPKHQFNINLFYNYDRLDLGLTIRHSGEKFDNDFSTFPAERVSLEPYTILNLSSSFKINELIKIFGRVENLTSEEYEDILYYGNLKRSAYLGFELNL